MRRNHRGALHFVRRTTPRPDGTQDIMICLMRGSFYSVSAPYHSTNFCKLQEGNRHLFPESNFPIPRHVPAVFHRHGNFNIMPDRSRMKLRKSPRTGFLLLCPVHRFRKCKTENRTKVFPLIRFRQPPAGRCTADYAQAEKAPSALFKNFLPCFILLFQNPSGFPPTTHGEPACGIQQIPRPGI